jgi:hypothetical protein
MPVYVHNESWCIACVLRFWRVAWPALVFVALLVLGVLLNVGWLMVVGLSGSVLIVLWAGWALDGLDGLLCVLLHLCFFWLWPLRPFFAESSEVRPRCSGRGDLRDHLNG